MSHKLPALVGQQRLRDQSAEALSVQLQAERQERGHLEFRQAFAASAFVGVSFGLSFALASHVRKTLGGTKRRRRKRR